MLTVKIPFQDVSNAAYEILANGTSSNSLRARNIVAMLRYCKPKDDLDVDEELFKFLFGS